MAMILTAFVPEAIQMLDDIADEDTPGLLGVAEDIRILIKRLGMLRLIIYDAECKSREIRGASQWLNNLRDVMYDVDDIIDHCKHEGKKRRRLLEQQARSLGIGFIAKGNFSFLSCFTKVAFRHKIGDRMKDLNCRLDIVIKEASKFQLATFDQKDKEGQINNYNSRIMQSHIVGSQIDDDTNSMIKLLTQGTQTFIAITGTAGIGKTTLAKRIYNDARVEAHFQARVWICSTQQLSDIEVLRKIISCAGESYGDAQTREQLELIVKRTIENKKSLIIFDGFWSNHATKSLFQTLKQTTVANSRILVTTRNEAVGEELTSSCLHSMKYLPAKDAWTLLCKMVFLDDQVQEIRELTDIGIKIARKCKGLPLSINIVAGVLRNKAMISEEWEKVYLDPAWTAPDFPNDITRVLYLGFEDLSSHLKQCFVYCSLFPEEHVFEQSLLTRYWIAEGFVEKKEDCILEDTAESYYKELISRNLLQPESSIHHGCKMHSLLRFFAHFVAGEENIFGNLSLLDLASIKPRRLSLAARGLIKIPDEVIDQDAMRTLLLFKNPLTRILPDNLFQKLQRLRVLDIHGTKIQSLPNSVGNLIHLRYLDVSETRLRQLPDTVECLVDLQFLIVRSCKLLRNLPRHLVRLQSLRRLELVGTKVNRIPVGIGKLKALNFLSGFVFYNGNEEFAGCRLEELQALSQLRYLSIEKLERVSNYAEAAKAKLNNKQHLKSLVLTWSQRDAEVREQEKAKSVEVLEAMAPPKSLELLEIRRFPGFELPSWFSSHLISLKKLKSIVLQQCSSIRRLPQLGHLPQLNQLFISGAMSVRIIDNEIFGHDLLPAFPKLETLIIEDMPHWEEWNWQLENGKAFPCLRELQLTNCPKLKSLTEGLQYATDLTMLQISRNDRLTTVKDLYSVKELSIDHSTNLVSVSRLPATETLKIINCPSLQKIEHLYCMKHLHIVSDSIDCLPEGLGKDNVKELEWLEIECNEELLRNCLKGGSEWPKLQHIIEVHMRTKDASKYLSYWREPESYETSIKITQTALVPVDNSVPSISIEPKVIPDSRIESSTHRNDNSVHSFSQKLLLILVVSVFMSKLLDNLFLSPVELFSIGAHFVSFLLILFSSS